MDVWIGITTFPDADVARSIARSLVTEHLVACVNIIPGVESIYQWGGKLETSAEVLGLLKFASEREVALRQRLVELHPYDTPEWVVVPLETGLAAYLQWVREGCAQLEQRSPGADPAL